MNCHGSNERSDHDLRVVSRFYGVKNVGIFKKRKEKCVVAVFYICTKCGTRGSEVFSESFSIDLEAAKLKYGWHNETIGIDQMRDVERQTEEWADKQVMMSK